MDGELIQSGELTPRQASTHRVRSACIARREGSLLDDDPPRIRTSPRESGAVRTGTESSDEIDDRIRLLFIIRWLGRGGAERQLVELVKGLDKQRFSITVATLYDDGALWPEMAAIEEIRLVSLHKKGRWDMLPFVSRFCRLVRRTRPHLTHGYMGFSNELGLLAKCLSGSRTVWGLRGSSCDHSSYRDWARGVGHRMGAVLSRFADRIIVNSEAGREEHIAEGFAGRRMTVVHNGIDTVRFHRDEEAGRRIRAEWGLEDDVPVIGIVARLDPMKDHPTFLRAAAMLARRHPEVRFVCVGAGSPHYRQTLGDLAEGLGLGERLLWKEARNDVFAVYNALTVLTSSSAFGEGFSNVIAEAMACETVAVVTRVGDSGKIVNDPEMAVQPRQPEALVAVWERVLELPPQEVAARGRLAREWIVRKYSLERLVAHTERTIVETLK